jgi:Domain of unknown function (DUF1992)
VPWLDAIAEQKIREAAERGEFADLPGQGRPLDLTGDPLVPEDLRVAYRILKNAGVLPPQLEAQKEIRELAHLIRGIEVGPERSRALRKLHLLNTQLSVSRGGHLRVEAEYYERLVERLSSTR